MSKHKDTDTKAHATHGPVTVVHVTSESIEKLLKLCKLTLLTPYTLTTDPSVCHKNCPINCLKGYNANPCGESDRRGGSI